MVGLGQTLSQIRANCRFHLLVSSFSTLSTHLQGGSMALLASKQPLGAAKEGLSVLLFGPQVATHGKPVVGSSFALENSRFVVFCPCGFQVPHLSRPGLCPSSRLEPRAQSQTGVNNPPRGFQATALSTEMRNRNMCFVR